MSWAQFNSHVNQLANALQSSGIGKGDKVATVLPNSLELLSIYWATISIGAVLVPLSPLLKPSGLINLLINADVRIVFLTTDLMTGLQQRRAEIEKISKEHYLTLGDDAGSKFNRYEDFIAASPDGSPNYPDMKQTDLFNIVYSSGTTGLPKGIMHSHLVRANYASHFAASFRMTPESVVLHTGSIVFNGAFVTLLPCFFLGARYILQPYFDVEAMIETIACEKVTHIMMVPAQIITLLQSPNFSAEKMQSMEMLLTIGAPLQQQYKEAINTVIPGRFYELYGLTEGFVTILDRNDFERYPGSVGCPPPGYEIRIVDEKGVDCETGAIGEIVGRGPALSSGYYKQAELTQQTFRDGWLYSGDLGYLNEDGYLYLSGRKKELIISGGVNVYPQDIEQIASIHEAILEVAVFGVDSSQWGETPVAAVLLKPEAKITAKALRQWINQRVEARFQKVSDLIIVEQMPRNAAGKTIKAELKEFYLTKR